MVNEILIELGMEPFDFNLAGGQQKWTVLHLAGCSGHIKVIEEVLSIAVQAEKKHPQEE